MSDMGFLSGKDKDEQGLNYEAEYYKEQGRIAKLWDAYEEQIGVLRELEKKVKTLEKELEKRELTIAELRELIDSRSITIPKQRTEYLKSRVKELENELKEERDKVVKIFELAQDLQDELNLAKERLGEVAPREPAASPARSITLEEGQTDSKTLGRALYILSDQLGDSGTSPMSILRDAGMKKEELDLLERELARQRRL